VTNKKNLTLVLALLLIAAVSMWAQGVVHTTPIPNSNTSQVASDQYHSYNGCFFCHTPHGTGTIQQPGTTTGLASLPVSSVELAPGAEAPGVNVPPASQGLPNSGRVYLWAFAMTPIVYTTWDQTGGPLSTAAVTNGAASPAVHSLLCLSCHDGATGGISAMTALGGNLTSKAYPEGAFTPGNGIASTYYNGGTSNNGWASTSGLLTNHPIHAYYPVVSTDKHYGEYWNVAITGTGAAASANFTDSTFIPWQGGGSAYPGHPARLYTDGTHAYVECTTCHEPHRQAAPAYQVKGTTMNTAGGAWVVGGSTMDYLRGPWVTASTASSGISALEDAGFCRTCHYEKTSTYINNNGGISD
jgi:cytochrome c553